MEDSDEGRQQAPEDPEPKQDEGPELEQEKEANLIVEAAVEQSQDMYRLEAINGDCVSPGFHLKSKSIVETEDGEKRPYAQTQSQPRSEHLDF